MLTTDLELKAAAREQRELTNPASAGNCAGEALRARCLDRPRLTSSKYSCREYSHREYSHSECLLWLHPL